MRRLGFDGILVSTALALVLMAPDSVAQAQTNTPAATEAAPPAATPPATDVQDAQPAAAAPQTPAAATEATKTDSATAPAAVPPDPMASLNAADRPIAEAIRDMLGSRLSRIVTRKNERDGIEAFYRSRNFAPLWIDNGAVAARTAAAIKFLGAVDSQGLDPDEYRAPDFKASNDPSAMAEADIRFSLAVLTYARHAQTGRVHFSRVSADIFYNLQAPEPVEVLKNLATATDVAAALSSYEPPQPGYKALKAKLAEARNKTEEPVTVVRVPEGPTMRPGTDDPRVPVVRKRLNVSGDGNKYDEALAEAVKNFQRSAGLQPDGLLGANTLRAMNGAASPRRGSAVDTILANLERWRWRPRDLGKAHVVLNIPDYSLKVMNNGAMVWTTRVVVGKPNTPTPEMTETMKFITVNPTWNVPPSIVYGEYLPALQQDPTVLTRMGLKVSQNRDGSIHVSQPPGDSNALGRIRFNFPNKFLVYQHDTPDKHLFKQDKRAYSHGCMRVQDPLKYGEVLLSIALPGQGYTAEKLRQMYGPSEQNINLPTPIPVHITYQTAYVDDSGELVLRDDIYGRDTKLIASLKGEERKVADIAIERREPSYARPPAQLPPGVLDNGQSRWSSGPSFFDRLFGYSSPPPAPPPGRGKKKNNQRVDVNRFSLW